MDYSIKQMSIDEAMLVSKWRYEEPYSIYNMNGSREAVNEMLNGPYYSVRDSENELIGYFCFGESAQVPVGRQFGAYDDSAIDIGLGMKPDMCGQGLGYEFLNLGVEFARRQFEINRLRLTVAVFNKRAIKVYEKIGFIKAMSFERISKDKSIVFDIMIK